MYTPGSDFSLVSNSYTPNADFSFSELPQATLIAVLDDVSGSLLAEQSLSAHCNQTLDDISGVFVAEMAFQKAALNTALDDVSAQLNAVIAPQGILKLPDIVYTPRSDFTLQKNPYTPDNDFVFSLAGVTTLDDTIGSLIAHYSDNRALTHVTLDSTAGLFTAKNIQNQAVINAVLGDVSSAIIAVNAPEASIQQTLDDTQIVAQVKYIENRASASLILDDTQASAQAVNAPQTNIAVTLEDINANIKANSVDHVAKIAATLDDISAVMHAEFDYNIHRLTVSQVCSAAENTQSNSLTIHSIRQSTQPIIIQNANQQSATTVKNSSHKIITNRAVPLPKSLHSKAEQTEPLHYKTASIIDVLKKQHQSVASISQKTEKRNAKTIGILQQMTPLGNAGIHAVLQDSSTSIKIERHIRIIDDPNPYTPTTDIVLDSAEPMDGQFNFTVNQGSIEFIQQQFNGLLFSKVNSAWQIATPNGSRTCHSVDPTRPPPPGTSIWTDPTPPDPDPEPNPTPQIVIPDQDSYFMQHLFNVTLLDTTPIRFKNINVSWNADAFAWSFTGSSLDIEDLPLVKQIGLTPVQLIATINGESWSIVIDKITRGRTFGKSQITVTGNGLSVLLGHPHRLASSSTQGGDLTVQQIADLQMPLGWSINWTAPTWLIPGGAYSHQNRTPIQAIADIAQNIGAMIVPDRINQVLIIMPRYPVKPWNFATATPDVIIPEAVITSVSEPSIVQSPINGVYVHGNEIGGQLAFCRFNGTAGDKLANTISNNLMTDPTGLRALGERILAAESTQPAIESMTMPMGGVVPLIEPGKFIKTTLSGVDIFGIVNSISINAEFAKVRQTIQIGEKTTNSWSLFKNLLPADPLLVGTLSSTDGSTSIITLIDGGVVRVRGTGVVAQKYYIRGGKIDGSAPNMTQSEIVI